MRIQEWNEDYLGGNVLSPLTIEFVLFFNQKIQVCRICMFWVSEYWDINLFKNFNVWASNLSISLTVVLMMFILVITLSYCQCSYGLYLIALPFLRIYRLYVTGCLYNAVKLCLEFLRARDKILKTNLCSNERVKTFLSTQKAAYVEFYHSKQSLLDFLKD